MVQQIGLQPRRRASSVVVGAVERRSSRWPTRLRTIGAALVSIGAGAVLGWVSTIVADHHARSIGAVHLGVWSYSPDAGTASLNPYLRAHFAATGEIPLPSAIGFTLLATRDGSGAGLDRRCSYRVIGPMPRARFWSLEATGVDGFPLNNPAGRQAFTSRDIVWEAGRPLTVALSPSAAPGNWLPLSGAGRLVLALRLYEPALPLASGDAIRSLVVPSVERVSCE